MTDWAFAPGLTPFDRRARQFLRARPSTSLVHDRALRSIEDFISRLEGDVDLPTPIGDLLVATHAGAHGYIAASIDNVARPYDGTRYEAVEEADASDSVDVDDRLLRADDTSPIAPRTLRILGCNIGAAEPFCDKLSSALGSNVNVRAPRHLNVMVPRSHGFYEHLAHDFTVSTLDRLATRDGVVAAFQQSGARFHDGSAVPPELFQQCVPRRLRAGFLRSGGKLKPANRRGHPRLGRTIGGESRLQTGMSLSYRVSSFTKTVNYPITARPPVGEVAQQAELERLLGLQPNFQTRHPFPVFERMGFPDLPSFMAGWRWQFRVEGQQLAATATRHDYRLSVPLVDIEDGTLLYNYHPRRGGSIRTLPEDDLQLFYTSP